MARTQIRSGYGQRLVPSFRADDTDVCGCRGKVDLPATLIAGLESD
jgi:hypothetical protein